MRIPTTLIALSLLLALPTGCGDDEGSASGPGTQLPDVDQDEFFRWTVGGDTITSNDDERFHGYLYTGITSSLQINGRAEDAKTTLRINFIGLPEGTTGTYDMMSSVDTTLVYTEATEPLTDFVASPATNQDFGATGSVTITRYDTEVIEGTFSFVGFDRSAALGSRDISDGSFRVNVR